MSCVPKFPQVRFCATPVAPWERGFAAHQLWTRWYIARDYWARLSSSMSKNDSPTVSAYKREVAFGMIGSILFSVLIIFANKFLFQHFDFQYVATLTTWHVLLTAVIVKISVTFGEIANKVCHLVEASVFHSVLDWTTANACTPKLVVCERKCTGDGSSKSHVSL